MKVNMNMIEYARYRHSKTRDEILGMLTQGQSCALLGFPGSGKTFMTADIVMTLRSMAHSKVVAISGSTGSAAQQLKSLIPGKDLKTQTIHSLLGFGRQEVLLVERGDIAEIEGSVKKQRTKGRYASSPVSLCDVLVVEEVSMLTPEFFQAMDSTMRLVRHEPMRKFGGAACLFVGDFRQLPPVNKGLSGYVFQHKKWSTKCWVDKVFSLEFIMRQSEDSRFAEMILRLSHNASTEEDMKLFAERIVPPSTANIMDVSFLPEALRVFNTNREVNKFNDNVTRAAKKEGKEHRDLCIRWDVPKKTSSKMRDILCQQLEKDMVFSREIFVGANVIVTANMAVENGIVNGTMGTVVSFCQPSACHVGEAMTDVSVELKLDDGRLVILGAHCISSQGSSVKGYYIPLLLSHALTVHRLQGSTVRKPLFFCPRSQGQYLREFYVIATRVVSLDLLYLTHLPDRMLQVIDPIVVEYYESLNT